MFKVSDGICFLLAQNTKYTTRGVGTNNNWNTLKYRTISDWVFIDKKQRYKFLLLI